jgi:exodeoxyribonuclease VII large subunit
MSAATPRRILTPSQLNALARSLLEDSFPLVEVEGEISNLARPASGHIYLTLKDRNAQIRCALFKPRSQWLRFKPTDGMQVLARGRLTLYEPRGDYQLQLEHMEPAGEGALQCAFEELKAKLQAEGLFAAERKRLLPARVARLAILTSPSGAAIHDVLTVLRRRYPLVEVDVVPVPVQGGDAPLRIVTALRNADACGRYDVILLTRGGGSLEDLAAFNDEALARAIVACRTVTVSAVGHEVDVSIADFAADLRCPTPSAAAETLVPDRTTLLRHLATLQTRLARTARRQHHQAAQRLDQLHARLQGQQPLTRLQRQRERLVALQQRLRDATGRALRRCRQSGSALAQRLGGQHPRGRLAERRQRLLAARRALQAGSAYRVRHGVLRLAELGRTLEAVSPLATLRRGYSVLRHHGHVVRSAQQVQAGDRVHAQLADGTLSLRVD